MSALHLAGPYRSPDEPMIFVWLDAEIDGKLLGVKSKVDYRIIDRHGAAMALAEFKHAARKHFAADQALVSQAEALLNTITPQAIVDAPTCGPEDLSAICGGYPTRVAHRGEQK